MANKRIPPGFTLLFYFVFIAFAGCRSGKISDAELLSAVKDKLGEAIASESNDSGTFTLFQQERMGDHALRTMKFLVVRRKDNVIVYESSYRNGHVKWFDNDNIEVFSSTPGKTGKSDSTRKIITVTSVQ